jgi:hypothetical protein
MKVGVAVFLEAEGEHTRSAQGDVEFDLAQAREEYKLCDNDGERATYRFETCLSFMNTFEAAVQSMLEGA